MGQLGDWQVQLGNLLNMMPRPNPGTNENQHKQLAQHIGSYYPRPGALVEYLRAGRPRPYLDKKFLFKSIISAAN